LWMARIRWKGERRCCRNRLDGRNGEHVGASWPDPENRIGTEWHVPAHTQPPSWAGPRSSPLGSHPRDPGCLARDSPGAASGCHSHDQHPSPRAKQQPVGSRVGHPAGPAGLAMSEGGLQAR
jgi:hypothetical protein